MSKEKRKRERKNKEKTFNWIKINNIKIRKGGCEREKKRGLTMTWKKTIVLYKQSLPLSRQLQQNFNIDFLIKQKKEREKKRKKNG